MDEVADGLFVGTTKDAVDESLLHEHAIGNIVSLTNREPEGGFPPGLTVLNVPLVDGPQNDRRAFNEAVTRVLSCLEIDDGLLVHCSAGASRSPAVAATALALADGIALDAAFQQVVERRDAADPHPALVRQAARVYVKQLE